MPAKFYTARPLEVFEYNRSDAGLKDELSKFGITFNESGTEVTGPGGNTLEIEDGDFISLESDGALRRYGKAYFTRTYLEVGQKPKPTEPPAGVVKPAEPDKRTVEEKNKTLRPDEKLLDQKVKPGEIPDQKAAQATKR